MDNHLRHRAQGVNWGALAAAGVDLEPHLSARRAWRRAARASRGPRVAPVDVQALFRDWTTPPRNRPPGLGEAETFLHGLQDAVEAAGDLGDDEGRPPPAAPPPSAEGVNCGCYGPADFGTSCNCGARAVVCAATSSGYCWCTVVCAVSEDPPMCKDPPYVVTRTEYPCEREVTANTDDADDRPEGTFWTWASELGDTLADALEAGAAALGIESDDDLLRECLAAAALDQDGWTGWCSRRFVKSSYRRCATHGFHSETERRNFCYRAFGD